MCVQVLSKEAIAEEDLRKRRYSAIGGQGSRIGHINYRPICLFRFRER